MSSSELSNFRFQVSGFRSSLISLWRDTDADIRASGRVVALALFIVGVVIWVKESGWSFDRAAFAVAWPMVRVWWGSALAVLVLSAALPGFMRPVYVVYMALAGLLGIIVPVILLTLVYFTIFTVTGLLRRWSSPVKKDIDLTEATYWEKTEHRLDKDSYYRQY